MDKWTPSEQYLKEVLCRARETDWEWSDYRANDALAKMADGTVRYRAGAPYGENGEHLEYNEYLWKRQNYPAIPETYMQPGKGWRGMSLSDILTNIFKGRGPEADHYRNILFEAIDSYRLAAKFMLIDTYRRIGDRYRYGSDEYVAMQHRRETIRRADSSGYEYMPEHPVELYGIFPFLGARECDSFNECRGEIDCSTDKDLVKKIIAVERIKLLISEWMQQDAPAEQGEEPAAVGGAADRQGVKPIEWRGTPEQLKELAGQLQEKGHIKYSQWFVERFGSDCPPDVDGWEGASNLLVYLLERLLKKRLLSGTRGMPGMQTRLESVFRIKSYKQKREGYRNSKTGNPKGADEIDRILSDVFQDS